MSGQKNTATRAANSRGGNQNAARRAQNVCNHSILATPQKSNHQFANVTNELADLRQRYNGAVLSKRWQDAEQLQRQYHAAERRRRAELLAQAEVRRG